MKLKLIPAGEFLMGSPVSEPGRNPEEVQHRVKIAKPFYMGVHEVTQEEYQAVMGVNPSWAVDNEKGNRAVAGLDTKRHPVEQVSWDDAIEFCKRLSSRDEVEYRLPTESEWEYACRAGSGTAYYFGEDGAALGEYACYRVNSEMRTHAVGEKRPNAWGLFDMHGNVWEWCFDRYQEDWYAQRKARSGDAPEIADNGPATGRSRLLRGGSWDFSADSCRSAVRRQRPPDRRIGSYGFRVCGDADSIARLKASEASTDVK
jgi:formylglycine-generating enzyme required for sulfatase activity